MRRLYEANPEDIAAFTREPSLSDPVWMEKIQTRITHVVQANRPDAPLFYNLADEPGIAETSAAWDFDFSPSSSPACANGCASSTAAWRRSTVNGDRASAAGMK